MVTRFRMPQKEVHLSPSKAPSPKLCVPPRLDKFNNLTSKPIITDIGQRSFDHRQELQADDHETLPTSLTAAATIATTRDSASFLPCSEVDGVQKLILKRQKKLDAGGWGYLLPSVAPPILLFFEMELSWRLASYQFLV